jgi:hypothetical protein
MLLIVHIIFQVDSFDGFEIKRSILVCSIPSGVLLSDILAVFENYELSGGGPIDYYAYSDIDKLQITYLNHDGLFIFDNLNFISSSFVDTRNPG